MTTEEIKSIFVKRYVIAISLIAFLSTSTFFILYSALSQSDTTALIVNISGKQRMLSQRVASLSQQYYWSTYWHPDSALSEATALKLREAIDEMRRGSESLSSGKLDTHKKVELSDEIKGFYFGPTHLKKRVDEYLKSAEHLLSKTNTKEEEIVHLEKVVLTSHELLPDLQAAVVQYQQEGDEKIARIQTLEWIAWIITLMVLMLEVIFIFQPMADQIRQLFQEIRWHEESLEQQVALRTLNLEQANLKLEKLASHDHLTGLKNRLYMQRDLEKIQKHYRENGLPYALVMFDIDDFKIINDTYGHDAGDFVLQEISEIFRENLRAQDSVYRAGGEEFVVLLNRISLDQAIEKMDELRQKIEKHLFQYQDNNFDCTISGGLYHSDMDGDVNAKKIMKLADDALYTAKHEGKNRIVAVSRMK